MLMLTAKEIAKEIRVNERFIYEMMTIPVELGGLKHYKFGRTKRVQRSDFELWLKSKLQA